MKTSICKWLFTLLLLITSAGSADAQGILSKVTKALSKGATKTTTASSLTEGNGTAENDTISAEGDSTSIDWDAIPLYHLQVINETNEDGTPMLNPDGTPVTRVLLVDQFGNYRSQEAVEAQRKALKKYINRIIAKVGGGAALGAVAGLISGGKKNKIGAAAIGAGAGAVAGALLSLGDIKKARAMNKSLKEQDKLMEVYRKNFTNEGEKVDAAANIDDIEGLTLDKESAVSKTASEIKNMVESESFNTPEAGIWDSI